MPFRAPTSTPEVIQMLPSGAPSAPARETPGLDPTLEFLRDVWALNHALERASQRDRRRSGLTTTKRLVLQVVGLFPGSNPGQVARLLHLHVGTLSPVFKALAAAGYLERSDHPTDARKTRLRLTPAGRRLAGAAPGAAEASVALALAQLDPARLAQAREVLERLTRALERANR